MKVYLLICDLGYDGDVHEGIFATKEAAEKAEKHQIAKHGTYPDYKIEEWEVL